MRLLTLEFAGAIGTQNSSEYRSGTGPVVDKTFVAAFARAHEYAGFDRVLIGYFSSSPDGFQVAAYAAQQAERLKFLLAHRPGFVAPTLAARQLATLDQFIDGRLAVHIITGGAEHEQARDGDFLNKPSRYARTDDYLDVLKKAWTSAQPFNHDGPFYKVVDSYSAVKPAQSPHLPTISVAHRMRRSRSLVGTQTCMRFGARPSRRREKRSRRSAPRRRVSGAQSKSSSVFRPRSPRSRVRAATRRLWSVPPSKWPSPCSITGNSASPRF